MRASSARRASITKMSGSPSIRRRAAGVSIMCGSGRRRGSGKARGDALPRDVAHEGLDIARRRWRRNRVHRHARTCRAPGRACRPPGCAVVGRPDVVRVPSRGEQVSSTQPEPPPSALPMATNSARHLATEPKSRAIASASAPVGIAIAALAQPVEVDLVQQRRVGGDQLLALQPVQSKAGGVAAGSSRGELGRIAFRRRTAPP